MNIGQFLDENYIKEEVGMDNMYQPEMSDLVQEEKQQKAEQTIDVVGNLKKFFGKLLMKGNKKQDLKNKYFSRVDAKIQEEIEKYLEQNEGLLGTVFIDCSLLDKEFDYAKCCNNKMKKYHRYAINCDCGHYEQTQERYSENNGDVDGFLSESKDKVKITKVPVCIKTGLPVLKNKNNIKGNVLNELIDLLCEDRFFSQKTKQKILNSGKLLESIKYCFVNLVGGIKIAKTNCKVDKTAQKFNLKSQQLIINPIEQTDEIENVVLDVYAPEGFSNEEIELREEDFDMYNDDMDDSLFLENNVEFSDVQVFAKPQNLENVQVDVYIPEGFSNDEIKIQEEDFDNVEEELKVSNKYSFDF